MKTEDDSFNPLFSGILNEEGGYSGGMQKFTRTELFASSHSAMVYSMPVFCQNIARLVVVTPEGNRVDASDHVRL